MVTNPEPKIVDHRFVILEELGRGGMGVVYRAQDRLTGDMVALKQVVPALHDGSTTIGMGSQEELLFALTREFKALAGLRHPHIISVLDYGFDVNGFPYFAMELLTKPQTLLEAADDASIEKQCMLLIQVLLALNYLHRCGILHRDLKPQNIAVVDGQVRVLDFGLAVLREQSNSDESSGTLAYMAPEVILGGAASEASDLYAVGVIAYELFAGRHPFDTGNTSQMIAAMLYTEPDLASLDLSFDIIELLEKLLQKEPANRYQSAAEVIDALQQISSRPVQTETKAIRESFLQAARFVGRDTQLNNLTAELEQTLLGRGRAWLVGGESGVGKSRLLDELRIYALVKGVYVLRGQEVNAGGNPYQPWREILRRMSLRVPLNPVQSGILKPLVPDIDMLLQRDVPDAPTLEAGAAQDRLFMTVEEMFRRFDTPALVMLEDLHWSDSATLLLMNRLQRLTTGRPLFILGSYRNDERPGLPGNLPAMNLMTLERFDDSGIEQLAVSMLGQTGKQPQVVNLLKTESAGNPFFVVEVVRALAEESGRLDKIGTTPLPARIFPGGVQEILQRRLSRVPASDLPLLQLAAVMGRQIDLAVLKTLAPDVDMDTWLANGASAAILEVADAQWRFAQDKLREGVLAQLTPEALKTLHRRAAEATEKIYPDGKGRLAVLALHHEMAGSTQRAGHWYHLAGKEAEAAYAPETAIGYYQKALAYLPQADRRLMDIQRGLGKMLSWQTRFDEAAAAYQAMRSAAEAAGDSSALVKASIGLYDVDDRRGDRKSALAHAEHAVVLARSSGEAGKADLADALNSKAYCLYRLKQRDDAVVAASEALAIATPLNLQVEIARGENVLGIINAITGRYDEANRHMVKALEIARALGDKRDVGIRLNNLGEVDKLRGDFTGAAKFFEEALHLFHEIGAVDAELAALTSLGGVLVTLGEYAAAEASLRNALALNIDPNWWGLPDTYRGLAEATLQQGMVSEALDAAHTALREAIKSEVNEFTGRAWRVVGMVLMHSSSELLIEEKVYSPSDCFEASLNIFKQESAEIEQAYTLRAWAAYEAEQKRPEQGTALWQEAFDIFSRNNFHYEVQKMAGHSPFQAG